MFGIAPDVVRAHFEVQDDGSFTSDTATIVVKKPG
jgi:hypothetical protein